MNDKIMNKATFSEICKIMKDSRADAWECIKGLFGVSLLFLPGLVCKETAILTNISNGTALLTGKQEIEKSIKNISQTFGSKQYTDFSTKCEHAQIAHILIVFAAYFDSIKMYLPDEEKKIKLSSKEKYDLTSQGIDKYLKDLEEKVETRTEERAREVFEYDLSLPDPINGLDRYSERLKRFYELLNREFIGFCERLSFWEALEEQRRDQFFSVIRVLPDKAVENYQKQYYELAVNFKEFFIWTNIQEHEKIQQSIDVGFAAISEQIQTYYEKVKDLKAIETLNKYERKYTYYIREKIIDTSEMDYNSLEDVVFPAKDAIFIPQRFKTLIYKDGLQLERDVWNQYEERENIGKFIADILRHPKVGELPLLILGLPGSGKSLLCNMLAAKILSHEYHVIIIKLRDTTADETISQQISQQMKRDFSNACTWDDIAESGINKPVLLIFDGYDELLQASGKTYSDYIKKIAEFQKEQKNIYNIFVKCIVTSRTTLIDKAFIMNNTPVIRLSDFDEKRIQTWSHIWNEKNKKFFEKNHLDSFEIDRNSKIYELAKQPLLLLMLALYDSHENMLKKQKDLNSTQLYYNLIWEFVSREKRKESGFRSKQESEQKKIINEEIRKISIAALGMYNRKALYIRSVDFESDITFIEEEDNYEAGLKDMELKESDRRIGSFLFIHKSSSTRIEEKEHFKDRAYEFLHNTFGEFLTAYFVVCETYIILKEALRYMDPDSKRRWNLADYRTWWLCLIYAPLFSRPVVVEMIHEWSGPYLKDKKMIQEQTEKSLDFLVNKEIKSIIHGEDLSVIKEIVEKKGNPFKQEEILKHLSVYSLNIIILRTIVCTNEHVFEFEDEDVWNKLVCLWKFAFSKDEFSDYANLFMSASKGKKCLVKYNCSNKMLDIQQKGADKLFKSYLAIGDKLTYSTIGALIGYERKEIIFDSLIHNELNVKAKYLWNRILRILNEVSLHQYEIIEILEEYNYYCHKEEDIEYLFAYYLLIEFLLKKKIIRYKDARVKGFLLHEVILKVDDMIYLGGRYDVANYLLRLAMDIFLDILDYIVWENDEIEKILIEFDRWLHDRYFIYNYKGDFILSFYNIIIRKISYRKGDNKFIRHIIGYNFEHIIDRILWNQNKPIDVQRVINDIIELSYNFMLLKELKYSVHLFEMFFRLVYRQGFKKIKIPMKQNIILIKYLFIVYQKDPIFLNKCETYIRDILWDNTVKRVFQTSEEAAIQLCYLAERKEIINRNRLREDLLWIVRTNGNRISEDFRRQIQAMAARFGWVEIRKALQK